MKANQKLSLVINIAALMVLMDLSAVNIALPSIREHFGLSVTSVSLLLMASMLTATGSALIVGKLIEIIRPGRLLILAFTFFGLTSALTAFSPDFYWMIPLRIFQGFAEATLYVIGPALIKKYMEKGRQQKEYGIWMMSCGLGISLGPLFGGLLIQYISWHSVFLINVPLAILGIIFSWRLDRQLFFEKQKINFDKAGALFSFLFLSFLIIFFNLFSRILITNPILWLSGISSLLFLFLFIRREKNTIQPILNLKLFQINHFWQANLGFFLFFVVNVGSRFLRPFYFEEARSLSSSLSGLLMMVAPTVMLIVSFFIDKISMKFNTKQLVVGGNMLLSLSMFLFYLWDENSSLFFLSFSMFILGLAMGIYYPATTQLGMTSLPEGNHGMGSASISISKSFGKLSGVLLFSLLFQFIFNLIEDSSISVISQKSEAVKWVFLLGFFISLSNTFLSFKIKKS